MKKADWRGKTFKEREVRNAIKQVLGGDEALVDTIFEIVKNQQGREPAGAYRDHIVELAFERGLLILGCGENSIRLAPPLIVNEHEAAIALDILEECVEHAKKDTAPRKEGEPMGA